MYLLINLFSLFDHLNDVQLIMLRYIQLNDYEFHYFQLLNELQSMFVHVMHLGIDVNVDQDVVHVLKLKKKIN